ncbi:TPM domain-containing protein [Olleya aquimaris]|uniref:TLP18.3/Psb32/MOLO-1 phosphatase superfamily protein n=1 Tax=Olleya aquimaris TaxID=639310 RepID=A0A327RES5_9FLAO|nr:TPM domain-containing protein [Olleya aquimaris]RAJ15201.1 TLP18.3/Psb32/MOLO-1 phosphatase superfamily protein [Olleya aquimaris]
MVSPDVESFLTAKEEQEIIEAIRVAEDHTSGEIRIHIEDTCKGHLEERALQVFSILKMHNTRDSNGVLIYVAVNDHKFSIYGDECINKVVPNNFWDETKSIIESHFKNGAFKQGLVEGVLHAGQQLKAHFPVDDFNTNELSNTISKG